MDWLDTGLPDICYLHHCWQASGLRILTTLHLRGMCDHCFRHIHYQHLHRILANLTSARDIHGIGIGDGLHAYRGRHWLLLQTKAVAGAVAFRNRRRIRQFGVPLHCPVSHSPSRIPVGRTMRRFLGPDHGNHRQRLPMPTLHADEARPLGPTAGFQRSALLSLCAERLSLLLSTLLRILLRKLWQTRIRLYAC